MKIDQASRRYFGVKCSGGQRNLNTIKTVVIHQTASGFETAQANSAYLHGRPDGSVHLVVDSDETYILANDRTICCGAAGFNTGALHIEMCGPAGGTKKLIRQWLGHGDTIDRAAYATARWLNKLKLPYHYLTAAELRGGVRKGWTQHRNVTLSGVGTTTHTDALRGLALARFKQRLRYWENELHSTAPRWKT